MLLVFDVNETLLDLRPLDEVFGDHRPWFDLLIRTALVRTAAGVYEDFGSLAGTVARHVLGLGPDVPDPRLDRLPQLLRSLPPHPDVVDGLRAANAAGHRLVALTNSPQATLDAQLEHSGLRPSFAAAYSVDPVRALKPARAAYGVVLDAERVDAADATLIAAHDWDVAGARLAGLGAVLVRRGGIRPLPGLAGTAEAVDVPGAIAAATGREAGSPAE